MDPEDDDEFEDEHLGPALAAACAWVDDRLTGDDIAAATRVLTGRSTPDAEYERIRHEIAIFDPGTARSSYGRVYGDLAAQITVRRRILAATAARLARLGLIPEARPEPAPVADFVVVDAEDVRIDDELLDGPVTCRVIFVEAGGGHLSYGVDVSHGGLHIGKCLVNDHSRGLRVIAPRSIRDD
ncbi:MAG: hypothetical protein QM809_18280 [Gordonia sp. (in: high G+C Gram-positive bacteria)]|uniref:hypothetical protein n=1 Tax=Gordonia sp. (in: high G+C Gram-positive bacteria) TaxID=84139 RepID=UPI0039E4B5E6